MKLTTKASIQISIFLILDILNIISASVKIVKRPRNNLYRNDAVYNNDNKAYDKTYFFEYRVHGADSVYHGEAQYFGQSEYRNNKQVSGKYYVQLPDGRVQVVKYSVDADSGYVADVSYVYPSSNIIPSLQ